jgi:hypothetical protein
MKRFLLLHIGFEKPTPQIMQAWQKWFESIAAITVEQGGFGAGLEVTASGSKELPWGADSITGYNVIKADNLQKAEHIASACPYVKSIRVYEIRDM